MTEADDENRESQVEADHIRRAFFVGATAVAGGAALLGAASAQAGPSNMRSTEMPEEGLPAALRFNPNIYWDPPVWPWLAQMVDKSQLVAVARIQLQLQRESLAVQIKAIDAMDQVLGATR